MQFFFATPKRLHRVHSHFFMVVLGMAEGGFLLPELLLALAVDVRWHGWKHRASAHHPSSAPQHGQGAQRRAQDHCRD